MRPDDAGTCERPARVFDPTPSSNGAAGPSRPETLVRLGREVRGGHPAPTAGSVDSKEGGR